MMKKKKKQGSMMTGRWGVGGAEEFAVVGGLIALQFAYAANTLLLSYFMSLGLKPLTIVIYSTFAAFLILSPLFILFERSKWPQKFSVELLILLVLIASGGVTLFQILMLKGIELTSPAIATAMPNLAPGLIFLIAAVLGLFWAINSLALVAIIAPVVIGVSMASITELSFNWTGFVSAMISNIAFTYRSIYSKKAMVRDNKLRQQISTLAGTLLCVVGAVAMSLLQSTNQSSSSSSTAEETNLQFSPQKIVGCVYLMAAVFVLSCNILLQASALAAFPAPMSECSIRSAIVVIISATIEFIQDRKLDFGWPTIGFGSLLCYSLLGGLVGGALISFNGWALKERWSVLVSMFIVGGLISLGSLGGMLLMFAGLLLVSVGEREGDKPRRWSPSYGPESW